MNVIIKDKRQYAKVSSDGCLLIEGAEHLFALVYELGGTLNIEYKATGDRFEIKRIKKEPKE